ncbi:MAG TPA: DUF1080 domain-containing protein [Phycisphaerae bacterium]|nr:DUF1080 domain-containing protein [Phycisphaerae bacterium]
MRRFALMAALIAAGTFLSAGALDAPAAESCCPAAREVNTDKPKEAGPKPDVVFDGADRELKQWEVKKHAKNTSHWTVGAAKLAPDNPKEYTVQKEGKELINATGRGVDIYSKYVHGDAVIKVEVMVPKGSNSGIYVHGEYEIQVLDSFGRDAKPGAGDMGAVYGAAPPTKPKYVQPGEWSTFEIHFLAPRFDEEGKKTGNAKLVKVVLNGRTIHEDLELKGPTPGGVTRKEHPKGPILFQGDHGPVAFRNITVMPMDRLKAAE